MCLRTCKPQVRGIEREDVNQDAALVAEVLGLVGRAVARTVSHRVLISHEERGLLVARPSVGVPPPAGGRFWSRCLDTVPVAVGLVPTEPIATGPASLARGPTYVAEEGSRSVATTPTPGYPLRAISATVL